jgi:sulfatase maturation enzyme AslB (radical SAM superfamily)
MTLDTAKTVVDRIFHHINDETDRIEIGFFGGEPLLEFDLIKEIFAYIRSKKRKVEYTFFATTNGTLLTDEMKNWFIANKEHFTLALSLDGTRETQNHNRCNSFDKIDLDFFIKNWPNQGVKMTVSEYSLPSFAKDIKFLHSCGFKKINGANLAAGDFDWNNDNYVELLAPQFKKLVDFYLNNDNLKNHLFDRNLALCEVKKNKKHRRCGVGNRVMFFDVDGKKYPCAYITPMTFSEEDLSNIMKMNFAEDENFIDEYCLINCYIYPICNTCIAENYLNNKCLKERVKSRCRILKLTTLFVADLQAKRIERNPKIFDDNTLYHTIETIKKIRELYLPEFEKYLDMPNA